MYCIATLIAFGDSLSIDPLGFIFALEAFCKYAYYC